MKIEDEFKQKNKFVIFFFCSQHDILSFFLNLSHCIIINSNDKILRS
jgi:hypothetical protein